MKWHLCVGDEDIVLVTHLGGAIVAFYFMVG
jgi:hypothetical protein